MDLSWNSRLANCYRENPSFRQRCRAKTVPEFACTGQMVALGRALGSHLQCLLYSIYRINFSKVAIGTFAVEALVSVIEAVGLEGKPTEWIPVWIGMAALAGGLGFIVEFFTGSSRIKDAKAVCAAGKAPRLNLREVRVPGSELARRFKRRFGNDDLRDDRENERMPIAEVPLWFLVTPRAQGFDVLVQRAQKSVIDHELLIARSAEFGLDWAGFCRWRTEEHNRERYTRSKEMHVRALGFEDGDR